MFPELKYNNLIELILFTEICIYIYIYLTGIDTTIKATLNKNNTNEY